jgi:hypothetical protein
MAQGQDVSLLNTVKLCHLCERGQRDTDSDWFPQSGMTLRDVEIIETSLVRFASKLIFSPWGQAVTTKMLACVSMLDPTYMDCISRLTSELV